MWEFDRFELRFLPAFQKDLQKLSALEHVFVLERLQKIKQGVLLPQIKRLRDYPLANYRLRLGDFRLLFDVIPQEKIIVFIGCKKRKDLY